MNPLFGGIVVAFAVWHTCWTVGGLRNDQELKEAGPVFGAIAAGIGVFVAAVVFPPVTTFGFQLSGTLLYHWAAMQAVNAMLLSFLAVFSFEFVLWSRRDDGYAGHLFGISPDELEIPEEDEYGR